MPYILLSIVIGDPDHFKAVNDELGHRAGSQFDARVVAAFMAVLERHDQEHVAAEAKVA